MASESQTPAYDRDLWMRSLESMALALGENGPPVQLCLIGSAACVFAGMELRTTQDLDIWQPSSDFDLAELRIAAEKSGLLFNPTDDVGSDQAYLQLVEAGIVQVGTFEPVGIFKIGRLVISRPPIENIIASKLIRSDAKDIEDIGFLYSHFQPDFSLIKKIIALFPSSKRETANENLVYLEILR
jgi:hypothetical protein